MPRIPFVCGNWKMFTDRKSGVALAKAVADGVTDDEVLVAVCPPYPYLALIADALHGTRVHVGAQNIYPSPKPEGGAFTGEISPHMLLDVGCKFVIVGHSERRHGLELGEANSFINEKVHAALEAGLRAILCVGETKEERASNQTFEILEAQLTQGLQNVSADSVGRLALAYEPVWAINTGNIASPQQAQEAHAFLRRLYGEKYGDAAAAKLLIQYGGSVKPDNARDQFVQPDVDGGLIGGASLNAESFLKIIAAARA